MREFLTSLQLPLFALLLLCAALVGPVPPRALRLVAGGIALVCLIGFILVVTG